MKKFISVLLVCALIAAMCVTLAGCGEKKDEDKTKQTETQTATSATTAATQANQSGTTGSASGSSSGSSASSTTGAGGHSIHDIWYAGISEQNAGVKALDNTESTGRIISIQTGYYSDGTECWVVEVLGSNGKQYRCYVSGNNCYVASDESSGTGINDIHYAGISEQKAGINALDAAGEPGIITSIAAGYYTDGTECWVITITANSGAQYTGYVSGNYCYVSVTDNGSSADQGYAGISEQQAGNNALSATGVEGAMITGISRGVASGGEECWYVTVSDGAGNLYTYAVTGSYCTPIN